MEALLDYWSVRTGNKDRAVLARRDDAFFLEVAEFYDDAAPTVTAEAAAAYATFKAETLRQFEFLRRASGLRIRPWLGDGQPYASAKAIAAGIAAEGAFYVYLTRKGFGQPGQAVPAAHPMLEESGVLVEGTPLCYNDLFRTVHDLFGHILFRNPFSLTGELDAAYVHLAMFPAAAHPAVLCETVAQICSYYRAPAGQRRYPEQKALCVPEALSERFAALGEAA